MNSPIITPDASVTEQSRKSLQDRLNGLGGINGRRLSPEAHAQKLREACEGFESIFIQKMWQEMRNTVPKSGLMQGREEKFWQDMYDQELSKSMTKAGGIGLADMMYEQLSRNLASASRTAAGGPRMGAFTPEAAPLFQESQAASPLAEAMLAANEDSEQPVAAAASIYDGHAPQTAPSPVEDDAAGRLAASEPVLQATRASMSAPQVAPVEAPVERPSAARKEKAERPGKVEKQRDNGLELAYLAKRDAGDKLGSRAVRPPLQRRNNKNEAPETAPEAMAQVSGAPGSAEGLRAALLMADSGAPEEVSGAGMSLSGMVAAVKDKNAAFAAGMVQPRPETELPEDVPQIRRVRKTTNVPKNRQAAKKDVIRMLNVDNAGANAGKGLAAYHAAQQQAGAPGDVATRRANSAAHAQNVESVQGAIKPLTVRQAPQEESPSFSIPPLKGEDS